MTRRSQPGLDEVVSDEALDEFARFAPEVVEAPPRRVPVEVSLVTLGALAGAIAGLLAGRVLTGAGVTVAVVVLGAMSVTVAVLELRSNPWLRSSP